MLLLEGGDGIFTLQCNTDVVQPFKQAVPSEGIYFEGCLATAWKCHLQALEVNGQCNTAIRCCLLKQSIDSVLVQLQGQQPTFKRIVLENIRETRRDDDGERDEVLGGVSPRARRRVLRVRDAVEGEDGARVRGRRERGDGEEGF